MGPDINNNRYQFIEFREVKTGKKVKMSNIGSALGLPSLNNSSIADYEIDETKIIAVIFDKQKGEVKEVDIKKLESKSQ